MPINPIPAASRRTARVCALLVLGAMILAAAPGQAGTCPAGQETSDAPHAPQTQPKGVTDTVIGSLDLAAEPIAIPGRQFRLRRLEVAPGGVVPFHSHAERPAIIYVTAGEITEYRSTCRVPIVHRAGDAVAETHLASHHWVNHGKAPAQLLSADLFPVGADARMM